MHRLPRPSPALMVSLTALFFALGGTAFAIGQKSVPQTRCQTGAIRGIAVVNGGLNGLENLSSSWTSDPSLFTSTWNCTGGQVLIRRPADFWGVEVQFVGNPAQVAVATATVLDRPDVVSVIRGSDGGFYISMGGPDANDEGALQYQNNVPFTIALL